MTDRLRSFTARGGWWVIGQAVLLGFYAVALFAAPSLTEGFGLGFAQIVGALLLALGLAVAAYAVMLLGKGLSPMPAPTAEGELVVQGPYRWVRHPIYGGVVLQTVGLGLVFLNPMALLFSFALSLFFMAKTGREEELLVDRYPEYKRYRRQVHYRLIPWLM